MIGWEYEQHSNRQQVTENCHILQARIATPDAMADYFEALLTE